MRYTTKVLAALAGAAALLAAAAEDVDDSDFLLDAMQTDLAEIRMSELAVHQGASEEVRSFATQLRGDHSRSLQETTVLAQSLGVTIPSEPDAAALEHHAALAKLGGAEFDAAFVSHMAMAHRAAIDKFSKHADANPNKAIADLAAKTLPTLERHLTTAETLMASQTHDTRPDPHLRTQPDAPSSLPR
jgi:putative membrane protein